jgi:acylphosphatase
VKRIHLIISGRVQGVGFRYFCQELAEHLRLTGYARNKVDGSVEVEAQGEEAAIERFAESVARGPQNALVKNVERDERNIIAQESSFEFMRGTH